MGKANGQKSRLLEQEKTFANNNASVGNTAQIGYYPHDKVVSANTSRNDVARVQIKVEEYGLGSVCDITAAAIMFKGEGTNGHGRTKRVSPHSE